MNIERQEAYRAILTRLPGRRQYSDGSHVGALVRKCAAVGVLEIASDIRSGAGHWDKARILGHEALMAGAFRDGGDKLLYGLIAQTHWCSMASIRRSVEMVIGRESSIEWIEDRAGWGELEPAFAELSGNGGVRRNQLQPASWADQATRAEVLDWLDYAVPNGKLMVKRKEVKKLAIKANEFLRRISPEDQHHHVGAPDDFAGLSQSRIMPFGRGTELI